MRIQLVERRSVFPPLLITQREGNKAVMKIKANRTGPALRGENIAAEQGAKKDCRGKKPL